MTIRHPLPDTPVSEAFHPQAYAALSQLLATPEIIGVGASVRDREILRLACLEKVRRDGATANSESGFVANFLANLSAPWAEDLVTYWHEGLGWGWNLWINGENPLVVRGAIDAGARPDLIFLPFPLPARLDHYACEFHEHWAFCRLDHHALPLSENEEALWHVFEQRFREERARRTQA